MSELDTVVGEAKNELATATADVKTIGVDIKTLFMSRVNDVILAVIVLASIWVGNHI